MRRLLCCYFLLQRRNLALVGLVLRPKPLILNCQRLDLLLIAADLQGVGHVAPIQAPLSRGRCLPLTAARLVGESNAITDQFSQLCQLRPRLEWKVAPAARMAHRVVRNYVSKRRIFDKNIATTVVQICDLSRLMSLSNSSGSPGRFARQASHAYAVRQH